MWPHAAEHENRSRPCESGFAAFSGYTASALESFRGAERRFRLPQGCHPYYFLFGDGTDAGFGENFGHGLGHGVGLLIHEAPRLARLSKDELKDGMVVTIEPGIYITGWGGVRIEDMVVLENGKARVMTHAPRVLL